MKLVIDTAIIAFAAASLVVVTFKGDEVGKAGLQVIKEVEQQLNTK